MKTLRQYIKLRKFNEGKMKEAIEALEGQEFFVLYDDGTFESVWFKDDLIPILRRDNKKKIKYVFDFVDRIIVDRDIRVE